MLFRKEEYIMTFSVTRVGFLLAVFLIPCSLVSQPNTSQSKLTPQAFVKSFYAWYVPHALNADTNTPWTLALAQRSADFSSELTKLLRDDSEAQSRCDELVGLDFDPFLNTQDPEENYDVGQVSQRGHTYWADIYGVRAGKRFETPALTVELIQNNGRWQFVNFHYAYPAKTDLITILKSRPRCSVPRISHRR
jgi:hypothetical protein